jgi:hypothetical protein
LAWDRLDLAHRLTGLARILIGAPGRPKSLVKPSGYWPGVPPFGGTLDAQAALSSFIGCGARICRACWHGGPKRRTRRRAPVPASFGRTGCPTATAGQNRAAARIPAAHRIGHQRVKRTARHPTISEAPVDLGTWSTAVDRKRTLVASRDSQIGQSDHAQQPSC